MSAYRIVGRSSERVVEVEFRKEFRKSRDEFWVMQTGRRKKREGSKVKESNVIGNSARHVIVLIALLALLEKTEALRITNFRVPTYVPASLPTLAGRPELAKPLLFDCDYDYEPSEDSRLAVKWFKNKETEPFYQWLPELNVRHFADWIRPLVNQTFISDPHDPLKRYRSLLIRRLSANLTGQYTCLVSSLAGQDLKQASLVVYQPPRSFTFEHRVFPAPALLAPPLSMTPPQVLIGSHYYYPTGARIAPTEDESSVRTNGGRPTQFRGYQGGVVHPPNNDVEGNNNLAATGRVVYTHDGRPIRKKSQRKKRESISHLATTSPNNNWQLRRRLEGIKPETRQQEPIANQSNEQRSNIQLHHFQCQASQVSPRPVILLTVKRDSESIAQYLHESSSISIRPYQVSHLDYERQRSQLADLASAVANGSSALDLEEQPERSQLLITLYDITVKATVALNVSLSEPEVARRQHLLKRSATGQLQQQQQQQHAGINTVLPFRRGQRMSFECHLEITGTEFEQRKRININEEEVYQFAEAEEARRRARKELESGGEPGAQESRLRVNSKAATNLTGSASLLQTLLLTTTLLLIQMANSNRW